MFLINITFALCIIGTIFLAIGINIKNKIVRNIGIAIFSIVIIFWIWFFSWFFIDEDEELKSKMGEETTNNVSESTRGEDITSQVISNDSSIYKYGIIRKIKDDKITFINKENNIYILENKEQIKYINGRTSEQCKFSDLKEGYYINTSYDRTCYIYKNITGEELKKELLKSLALPDDVDILRTSVDEIKDVKQLGNNEALVTFEISDIIKAENYPEINDEEHKFEVTLKVNNNTKYNLNFHGQDTYNAETIENSKWLMLYIRLDANTLNDEYPCISMFDSYSN
ncbi:unknown [Clostridium sp. CAG:356]|nr:unknown [Clostridium sp. CAG:356]